MGVRQLQHQVKEAGREANQQPTQCYREVVRQLQQQVEEVTRLLEMFRRRSSSKKSSEDGGSLGSSGSRKSSFNSPEEEVEVADGDVLKQGSPVEVLASLLVPPVTPKIEVKSALIDAPEQIALDVIPSLWKLGEWSLLYVAGWLGLSCAWILLFATLHLATAQVRQQARQRSRINPKSSSKEEDWKESELLHSLGPDSLPSWVTFPDVDRAEWINVILRKLWPKFGDIGNQIAKLLVEPKINEIMKRLSIKGLNLETLSNFKIKQLVLGSIPARVQGIRVYERNTARDELVVDVEVMYAGDLRVKFALQGLDCEINQLTFRGTIRIVLKPLMSIMPVVGGLELYFLSLPTLDFNLGGIAAAGDLPGISNIIRSIIDCILKRGFVWPNRFRMFLPMKEVENAKTASFPMAAPQGVFCVGVSEGQDLVKKDKHLIGGKSDPYVVLRIGESKVSFKDQYVNCDVNPVWNYEAHFPVEQPNGHSLQLQVFDFDAGSDDDFLGQTSLEISSVVENGPFKDWVTLEDTKHGLVHLVGIWGPIREKPSDEAASVISLYVDSCRQLQLGKPGTPYARCEIKMGTADSLRSSKKPLPSEGLSIFVTKPRLGEHPVFEEGNNFVCRNIQTHALSIQVIDHKSGAALGQANIKVTFIASQPGQQFHRMDFPLEGAAGSEACVTLSAKLHHF